MSPPPTPSSSHVSRWGTCVTPSQMPLARYRRVAPRWPPGPLSTPPHLRCGSRPAAAGFVCVVVASYYTPQHPTSAAWGRERGRRPPAHYFSLPVFFFSLLQQSRRSRSIGLEDTRSRGLFVWGCRRQSSVSRKRLRNSCPVFHPPDWTIRGRLMETNCVLSNLCGGLRVPSGGLRVIRVGSVTSLCSSDWLRGAFSVTLMASPEATRHFAVSWVTHARRSDVGERRAGGGERERVVCRCVFVRRAATLRPVGRHNVATWWLLMRSDDVKRFSSHTSYLAGSALSQGLLVWRKQEAAASL